MDVVRTEDGVIVRSICIQNVSKTTKTASIYEYFKVFGAVSEVQRCEAAIDQMKRCVVQFVDACSAASALYPQRNHIIDNKCYFVEACYSWEQEELKIADTSEIVLLHDYSLNIILSHLNLCEQLRLSMLHQRLEDACTTMILRRYANQIRFCDLKDLSLCELGQYFKCVGYWAESILMEPNNGRKYTHWQQGNLSCFKIISMYCTYRLIRIKVIENIPFAVGFLNELNNGIWQLCEVELYECDLSDTELRPLSALPRLLALGISKNVKIRGDFLPNLCNIQRLSLYGCKNIEANLLDTAITNMSQLQYLDIRAIPSLASMDRKCLNLHSLKLSFNAINFTLPQLKSLSINHLYFSQIEHIACVLNHATNLEILNMRRTIITPPAFKYVYALKNLRVFWCDCLFRPLISFPELAAMKNLVELNLDSLDTILLNDFVLLITSLKGLKRLGLCSSDIDDSFILSAIQELNEYMADRPQLLLLIRNTRVTKSILENPCYRKAQHWLKLLYSWYEFKMGMLNEDDDLNENFWK